MIFELIIRYIEENWTWIIAGFATAFVAITILTRKRKASKSCTGIKGEEEQSKTILKGRKLAVFFNGRFTISGYAASIIGTRWIPCCFISLTITANSGKRSSDTVKSIYFSI